MDRIKWKRLAMVTLAAMLGACSDDGDDDGGAMPALQSIELSLAGRYSTGVFDEGAAEIVAFDAASKRAFVVNGADSDVDILDLSNPAAPTRLGTLDLGTLGSSANSVAVRNGIVAVAVEAADKQAAGKIGLFRAADGALLGSTAVGSLPDMITFTPDGKTVLVANEGEPSCYGAGCVDPEGSVAVVDVRNPAAPVARIATFHAWDAKAAELRGQGVRIYGPGASVSQDLEPEYIAVAENGAKAWVTLQENNAIAEIDVAAATVTAVRPLGYKDHGRPGNELDPSDRDGGVHVANWPVFGMYQPDSVAAFTTGGETYLLLANEGDAREYDGLEEETRIKDLDLDPTVFPDAADLQADAKIGRLNATSALGDIDGDGDFDRLYVLGGRSFSVRKASDASLVFDSGADFEDLIGSQRPATFNVGSTDIDLDSRSDSKGPEPEALTSFAIEDRHFVVVGLERDGGLMIYDVTAPAAPVFVQYISARDYTKDPETQLAEAGDLAPEGLAFVPGADSPTGVPLLLVANETSGTTSIYNIALRR